MRQNKIFICFSIPLMLVLTNVHADYFSYEKKAIAQVKATPASKIDPNLPVLPYEQWVRNLAGKDAKIQWELNDCGEGTGGPADRDRDMPLCVGTMAKLTDGRWFYTSIGFALASEMKRGHFPVDIGLRDFSAGYKEKSIEYGSSFSGLLTFMNSSTLNIKLLQAAIAGDVPTAQALLRQGADVNFKFHKTPLLEAADNGRLEIIPILLGAGADINARDKYDDTALSLAAHKGYIELVKLLLSKGSDESSRNRALISAAMNGRLEITQTLLKAGANVSIKDDHYAWTPLMWAARGDHYEVMRTLLEAGADINAIGAFGATALGDCMEKGSMRSIMLLLEHGADVNLKGAFSPLMKAAGSGSLEKVRILLEKGADINVSYDEAGGRFPLMDAVSSGNIDVVKLLIEKGADLHLKSKDDSTALSTAIKYKKPNIAKVLEDAERFSKK